MIITILILAVKLLGLVSSGFALGKAHERVKNAKAVANMPTTKQERTDAANTGKL